MNAGTGEKDERLWPPAELVARLARHEWPGNVRELKNAVRRLVIAGRDEASDVLGALLEEILAGPSSAASWSATSVPSPEPAAELSSPSTPSAIPARRRLRKVSDVGEEELLEALEENRFKLQPTAETLGLSRINLYRLIESTPSVRKASDLTLEEVEEALRACDGDQKAAAFELRVSLQGLKRQTTALGLVRR